mgnify:FL=1
MKELRLERTELNSQYTVGKLYYNDVYICDTLEDTVRETNKNGVFDGDEKKIYGKTAIPYGDYPIRIMYSPKFQRNMPYIMNVNSFTGVMIHWGNTVEDTLGCVLVGEFAGNGKLINSRATFDKVYNVIRLNKVDRIVIK